MKVGGGGSHADSATNRLPLLEFEPLPIDHFLPRSRRELTAQSSRPCFTFLYRIANRVYPGRAQTVDGR